MFVQAEEWTLEAFVGGIPELVNLGARLYPYSCMQSAMVPHARVCNNVDVEQSVAVMLLEKQLGQSHFAPCSQPGMIVCLQAMCSVTVGM